MECLWQSVTDERPHDIIAYMVLNKKHCWGKPLGSNSTPSQATKAEPHYVASGWSPWVATVHQAKLPGVKMVPTQQHFCKDTTQQRLLLLSGTEEDRANNGARTQTTHAGARA
eukprot:1158514-Pelagomonas_calceolata.AAC.1